MREISREDRYHVVGVKVGGRDGRVTCLDWSCSKYLSAEGEEDRLLLSEERLPPSRETAP